VKNHWFVNDTRLHTTNAFAIQLERLPNTLLSLLQHQKSIVVAVLVFVVRDVLTIARHVLPPRLELLSWIPESGASYIRNDAGLLLEAVRAIYAKDGSSRFARLT